SGAATSDEGAVLVLHGRPATGDRAGLRGDRSVELSADSPHVAGDGRAMDQLGTSVAVGDVHGDGFADVALGAIGRDVGGVADAGAVLVLEGSASGIRAAGSRQHLAGAGGVAGAAEAGDRLGSALALGDLDGDGDADLLAGIAGQSVGGSTRAGAVLVLRGGEGGLTGVGSRQLHQGTATTVLPDRAEALDVLGSSVAIGDFDGNRFGDLVLGIPGEDVGAVADAGSVTVVPGSGGGFGVTTATLVDGGDVPPGEAEPGDRWGGLFPIHLR
ncbi:MAG TPA: FG-GAP repeat protein, partial [Acidimicrobiales bacterium]|nr:FG-GAP repeat protein [Acidimicrobiales bacterium]